MNLTHDPRKEFSDWFLGTNGVYDSGPNEGQSLFTGTANLFCIKRNASNPAADGEINYYDIVGVDQIFDNAGAVSGKGEALIHWIFDTYYATDAFLVNGTGPTAFQAALWEVDRDYNGTIESLDLTVGHTYSESYRWMFEGLVDNYDSISSGYRSTNYQFTFLKDASASGNLQDLIMITPIPEPGSAALAGLAASVALLRRRRNR